MLLMWGELVWGLEFTCDGPLAWRGCSPASDGLVTADPWPPNQQPGLVTCGQKRDRSTFQHPKKHLLLLSGLNFCIFDYLILSLSLFLYQSLLICTNCQRPFLGAQRKMHSCFAEGPLTQLCSIHQCSAVIALGLASFFCVRPRTQASGQSC